MAPGFDDGVQALIAPRVCVELLRGELGGRLDVDEQPAPLHGLTRGTG